MLYIGLVVSSCLLGPHMLLRGAAGDENVKGCTCGSVQLGIPTGYIKTI